VAASLIAIPFYVLQPRVLWAPLAWSVVFAGINLLQSWLLFIERRPVKLTAEEAADLPLRDYLLGKSCRC
jgi:hypothetical protein